MKIDALEWEDDVTDGSFPQEALRPFEREIFRSIVQDTFISFGEKKNRYRLITRLLASTSALPKDTWFGEPKSTQSFPKNDTTTTSYRSIDLQNSEVDEIYEISPSQMSRQEEWAIIMSEAKPYESIIDEFVLKFDE